MTPSYHPLHVALLTGGQDRPYAFGLATVLASKGVRLDIIGSDEVDTPEFHNNPHLRFLNLRGNQQRSATFAQKCRRILLYYLRLVTYAPTARPAIFHILWNNRLEWFDRTLLMLYYKLLGKKIVLTAHNVNAGRRDSKDSPINRLTLRCQYSLCDHIFVHTNHMKSDLVINFHIPSHLVTVLKHPLNNAFPHTDISPVDAKQRLGLHQDEKAILFLGRIQPYKGIEYLIDAFQQLDVVNNGYRLIIAGEPKRGSEDYLERLQQAIRCTAQASRIIQHLHFIPDAHMELYLKAADVLVLPYKDIFQSGVLFLAFTYGLPVVASDVGSFREDIVEGHNGFLCVPGDSTDLARAIRTYFESDLYKHLDSRRSQLQEDARTLYAWEPVGDLTCSVYSHVSHSMSHSRRCASF